MFEKELDRYESSLIPRVGATAAREARREMALHLEADHAARIESGFDDDLARRASLEAIGDLDAVAREEAPLPPGTSAAGWGEAGLVIAGLLLYGSWAAPGLSADSPRLALNLMAALTLLGLGIVHVRTDRRPYGWPIWAMASVLPLLVVGLFLFPMTSLESSALLLSVIGLLGVGSFALGVIRRRTIWKLGLVVGTVLFLAQTLGVEIMLRRSGSHPGYPVPVTVGTWLAFTLPLLVLSALGAGAASLVGRGVARLRSAAR